MLPRSPLPAPPSPGPKAASKSARAGEPMVEDWPVELTDPARVSVDLGGDENVAGDAEIVWDDAPPEPPRRVASQPVHTSDESVDLGIAGPPGSAAHEAARSRAAAPGRDSRARRKRASKQGLRPTENAGGAPIAKEDRQSRRPQGSGEERRHAVAGNGQGELVIEIKPASRIRTLNRWLLVIVPVFVLATVAWRYRYNARQGYPAIIERGRTEGIAALEAGDYYEANQLLSAARSAVDGLGGAVDGAQDIRDAAGEAAIFVDLITQDLGELLYEAGRAAPETWESRFDSVHKGRSIIIDSIVNVVPDGSPSSRFELLLRILPPGEATKRDGQPDLIGEIDLTGFKLFELSPPKLGDRKIFGAKLASFRYDSGTRTWMIRLQPESGVFITHTKALDSMSWRDETIPAAELKELEP